MTKSLLNIMILIIVILTTQFLSGCLAITVPSTPPDTFHEIETRDHLLGSDIREVIKVVGMPEAVLADSDKQYFVFKEYGGGLGIGLAAFIPIVLPVSSKDEGSIHCLLITTDVDRKILGVRNKSSGGVLPDGVVPESCVYVIWDYIEQSFPKDTTEETLIALAAIPSKTEGCANESGNTLSEYRLKYFYDNRTNNPIASKTMLCLAADDGSSEARYLLGDIFWFGTETERNLKRAYVWYRLSEDCGHYWASKAVQRMQKLLTQNELAEAEESLKDWKPGQCKIELKLP